MPRRAAHCSIGLLPLPAVWAAAAGAPGRDRTKFRDELLWQEYARHLGQLDVVVELATGTVGE